MENVKREDVNSTVDNGGDVTLWFLHKVKDGVGGFVLHNAAVVHRLLPGGLGAEDGGDGLVLLPVELQHSLQGKLGADVSVHHKESVRVAGSDLVPEVIKSSGRPERSELLEVTDADTLVHPVHLADKVCHLIGRVEAENKDFPEILDLGTGLYVVLNYGKASHGEERLGNIKRQWSESRAFLRSSNQNDGLQ